MNAAEVKYINKKIYKYIKIFFFFFSPRSKSEQVECEISAAVEYKEPMTE